MNMGDKCIVFGAGGHAAVVLDAIQASGEIKVVGILDPDSNRWNTECLGFPIIGSDDELDSLRERGVTHFVVGLAQIGPSPLRRTLFERAIQSGMRPHTVRHPSAIVSSHAVTEEGVQALAGAIINARAHVKSGAIINTGAIVEHDAIIERFAHIAPGACICGGAVVGEHAFIGAGGVVIQNVHIGAESMVAAGAVVCHDLAPGSRVAGVPARIMSD